MNIFWITLGGVHCLPSNYTEKQDPNNSDVFLYTVTFYTTNCLMSMWYVRRFSTCVNPSLRVIDYFYPSRVSYWFFLRRVQIPARCH